MKELRILVVVLATLTRLGEVPAAADGKRITPLSVCLTWSAAFAIDVPNKALLISEAATVWRPLGVAIGVRGECQSACGHQILLKSAAEADAREAGGVDAIAWVPFVEGRAGRTIFVDVGRARSLARASNSDGASRGPTDLRLARLLGRSLAHEIGHVLLNSADHEPSGLMRARYSADDALRISSAYSLDARQRERLTTAARMGSNQCSVR